MTGRSAVRLVAALVCGVGLLGSASAVSADDPCHVYLHDHTPGVFPGGFHLHTDCLDK